MPENDRPEEHDPLPQPPAEPDPFSCCGSDCGEACVWSIYEYEKRLYEQALAAWRLRQAG